MKKRERESTAARNNNGYPREMKQPYSGLFLFGRIFSSSKRVDGAPLGLTHMCLYLCEKRGGELGS